MLHEGTFTHPNVLVQRVFKGVANYEKTMESANYEEEATGQMMVETWKKPPTSSIKSMFGSAIADPKRAFEVSKARFRKKMDVW